jgi:NAD-dependent SIR2 family protein deacetylase
MASCILIGNTSKQNESGTWDWTFYVRPAEYIEEVVVTLHPTFKHPVHRLQGPKLELSCSGWGTFELKVDIHWRGGGKLKTEWMLEFGQDTETKGDFHKQLEIPIEVLQNNGMLHNTSQRPAEMSSINGGYDITGNNNDRDTHLAILAATQEVDPGADPMGKSWHGRVFQQELPKPIMTWESKRRPREDKHGRDDVPEWLSASEYKDDAQVLALKVRLLADLLRCSKRTLAYTGAGLSVAAGIEMAAAGSSKAKKSSPLEADPTLAHCTMAELNGLGFLHGWVQQNHDGLPQKAGYRQEDINEIHGSWYDPSNPVVLYSGSLRGDLFDDMRTWAKTADLVLVLGTSLSGLNADQCVTKTAARSCPKKDGKSTSLGSVIISPQRTPEDGAATLRIFATADEVMAALAAEFNVQSRLDPRQRRARFSSVLRAKVPYDRNGRRSDEVFTWWDLSPGSKLRVSCHNNIEGAQQPSYLHITPELTGTALPLNEKTCCISIQFSNASGAKSTAMQLGIWWIDAALRGGPEYLPVVNINAVEERRP